MKKVLSTLLVAIITTVAFAQEEKKPFKVEIHGFVGVNAHMDTRQSATARNGNIYLFPKAEQLDAEGNDLNDHASYDIDAAFSRFNIGVSGPDMFGAKSFAFIEGDFLGDKNPNHQDVNFRLRHAFIRLNWKKTSLLFGQYWHPLFITENFANTVNLSCGTPYHPLNRQPMLRVGRQLSDKIEVIGFLMSQNDFLDKGMPKAAENSLIPEMALQAKYKSENFFAAATGGYKVLKPSLADPNTGIKTDETATGGYLAGSLKYNFGAFTFKTEVLYTAGMTNVVMLGGFAEKTTDTPEREYSAIKNFAYWADVESNAKKVKPGVLFGYTKNLGAIDEATPLVNGNGIPTHTIGGNIANMYSFIPRVKFMATPKIWFGLEWMYTVAAIGSTYDEFAIPTDTKDYSNSRFTASMRYTF
ncbi:hypothetical protein [Carboxylicivirga sp. M1479]|uniref:hypothetical protein n=1 Tax=Carboxylicivirga sp. M1479 TaxID=2594476 RepID=UPI001177BCAA|nr:hypothetical protein [Carboxylicivirga sp. M1479]TRX72678.1 hypothetical protein FNN09_01700 [Carboxylicivirga sp. M1479]